MFTAWVKWMAAGNFISLLQNHGKFYSVGDTNVYNLRNWLHGCNGLCNHNGWSLMVTISWIWVSDVGYGFLTIRLLSSLKSDIVHTVWSFFGMMKEGKAHLDDGCHFNTPINIRRSIFFINAAVCIFGIGYGLPWYSLAPSFNSKETGGNFQSLSVPSKSSSNLKSNASSELQCDVLRCTQLFFTMLGRSALSY